MNKKKLFGIILTAVITASIMISYKNASEYQVTDAFLRNSNTEYACSDCDFFEFI